jgi:hypothetical protein
MHLTVRTSYPLAKNPMILTQSPRRTLDRRTFTGEFGQTRARRSGVLQPDSRSGDTTGLRRGRRGTCLGYEVCLGNPGNEVVIAVFVVEMLGSQGGGMALVDGRGEKSEVACSEGESKGGVAFSEAEAKCYRRRQRRKEEGSGPSQIYCGPCCCCCCCFCLSSHSRLLCSYFLCTSASSSLS